MGDRGSRATHRDVARLAGTSPATVSLVLGNKHRAVRISERTRHAVLAAARELGYVPDLGARRLRVRPGEGAAPDLVVAVLRPYGPNLGLAGGLAGHILEAASASLRALPGSPQLVLEYFEPGRLNEHQGLLSGARFHGAIITGLTPEDEAFLDAATLLVPVIAYQRTLTRAASVDADNRAGGAEVARHFAERGRRRPAAITYAGPRSRAVEQRVEGFLQAAMDAGLPAPAVATIPAPDPDAAAAAAGELLERDAVDALFAVNDLLAVAAMHAAIARGKRVPEQVGVVGYDDVAYARFQNPPLSTVRLPYTQMGTAAVDWLYEAIHGREQAPLRRVFRPELVVRASS